MNYMLGNNEEESSSGCESGWTVYLQHSSLISGDAASYDPEHDSPDTHTHSRSRSRSRSRGNRVFTKRSKDEDEDEYEDEDMSMVSDASSGPPHLHEEESYGGGNNNYNNNDQKNSRSFYPYAIAIDEPSASSSRNNHNKNSKKKKNRENHPTTNKLHVHQHSSLLDDTASSPFLNLCNTTRSQTSVDNNHVMEYSQGYSTTQFEVRPQYQEEHYDFFQSGNQLQHQNHSWFEGKRW